MASANPFSQLQMNIFSKDNLVVEKSVFIVCNNQLSIVTRTVNAVCNTTISLAIANTGLEPIVDLSAYEPLINLNKAEATPAAILNESAVISNSISPITTGTIVFSETPVLENGSYVWHLGQLDAGTGKNISYSVDGYLSINDSEINRQDINYTLPSIRFLLKDGKVGDNVSVKVVSSITQKPIPDTTVDVYTPSDQKLVYLTDDEGNLKFTPKEAGLYKYAVANRTSDGISSNFMAEANKITIEKPPIAAALQDTSYESTIKRYLPAITVALVVLILVVIGATYFFLRPGREDVVEPPKGLVEEAARDFVERKKPADIESIPVRPSEKPKLTIAKKEEIDEAEEPEEEVTEDEREDVSEKTSSEEKDYEDQLRKLIEEAQKFRKKSEVKVEEDVEEEKPKKQKERPVRRPEVKKRRR